MTLVVLVDEQDREVGTCDKIEAHRRGLLHRAVSVIVRNDRDDVLIQRRARGKYHSGGLWSNSACTHPGPGEELTAAARRCLESELGIKCAVTRVDVVRYRSQVSASLVENELDHVFVARFSGWPVPNPDEVEDWRWTSLDAVGLEIVEYPETFTAWAARVFGCLGGHRVQALS